MAAAAFADVPLVRCGSALGERVDAREALAGKHVALYFSAHWCPPCRHFTPQLVKFYNELPADKRAQFEIVFVSSDNSQHEFDEYAASMPWLAVSWAAGEARRKLASGHSVFGIPSLFVLDAESGEVTTRNGRAAVAADPSGDELPWRNYSSGICSCTLL